MRNEMQKRASEQLQLEMLRMQQGLWQRKAREIWSSRDLMPGKGGCIREITEVLDPRGVAGPSDGPPTEREQGTHWLYRFGPASARDG